MFLFDVVTAFEKKNIKYALVGGYAMALHGIVRATMDVDLIMTLSKSQLQAAEEVLNGLGLRSRLPVTSKEIYSFKDEYIENRNLVAWSFVDYDNPSRVVDILLIYDIKSFKIEKKLLNGKKIKVISLDDIIKMKKKSGRPKDLLDLELIQNQTQKNKD